MIREVSWDPKKDDRGPLSTQSSLCELLSQICVFEFKRWHIKGWIEFKWFCHPKPCRMVEWFYNGWLSRTWTWYKPWPWAVCNRICGSGTWHVGRLQVFVRDPDHHLLPPWCKTYRNKVGSGFGPFKTLVGNARSEAVFLNLSPGIDSKESIFRPPM